MAGRVAAGRRLSPAVAWRRRAIAAAVVVVVVLAGYYLWLRDSSLFAIDEVEVEGATVNRDPIAASLEQVASEMTTLHVDDEKLRDAVSGFPTIASIKADASIPDSLTVTVTERLPVARVGVGGGEQVAVSADGFALPGVEVDRRALPPLDGTIEAGRLDPEGAQGAAIAGEAPAELRERIESLSYEPDRGVVVELANAPELRFGDGSEPERKWEAVLTVLADPELGSPAYLDASVPERPVTGGFSG